MARYKSYSYAQGKFIPVHFEKQILPGTFEYSLNHLIDHELDLTIFNERYRNEETGATGYDPKILLKIILFAYSRGITSRRCIGRGVTVRINTNSLASTDNLQAFSGYRNQRKRLLKMGIQIYECKPKPDIQQKLMQNFPAAKGKAPIFSLHAKTMVIDKEIVFIGTFNLDPRSENLNTEAGAIIHNSKLARKINDVIAIDMAPGNSWDAAKDEPDQYNSFAKRNKIRLYQMMPIKPLL